MERLRGLSREVREGTMSFFCGILVLLLFLSSFVLPDLLLCYTLGLLSVVIDITMSIRGSTELLFCGVWAAVRFEVAMTRALARRALTWLPQQP